jgi:hypothetical protein
VGGRYNSTADTDTHAGAFAFLARVALAGSVAVMKLWSTLALACALLVPAVGEAKKTEDFRHTYDQVWGAAVRLIRVDQGYPIKDRDETVGYFLFDYKDDGRLYPGSVELVRIEDQGGGPIRVVIQIPAMPSYIERMLLDKLQKKLIDEYGEPAPPPKKPVELPPEESDEE